MELSKSLSHGRIGEAIVAAKCWMNGIQAHNTNGLRANFAKCDLIVDTVDPRRKLLIQVKSGYARLSEEVYLTQASGPRDLEVPKFESDFVVFVNIDQKAGKSHAHDGTLNFQHFVFYVVPADEANQLFHSSLLRESERPKLDGGKRSLSNLAVCVKPEQMTQYLESWSLIRSLVLNKSGLG